jgi:hypothetical protein
MDVVTYTGTGASNSISSLGFSPDLVWIKSRSNAYSNRLADTVRGAGKELFSDSTIDETTNDSNGFVSAFNSNGFTVTDGGTSGGNVKANSSNYVAWQWKAGSISSNTSGSITSTISTNATAGFSIVTYTGTGANATVGHGLGVAPKFIIIKNRSTGVDWRGYHASLGSTAAFGFNLTATPDTNIAYFNNTNPTSSVYSLGNGLAVNGSGNSIVAYCWAEIAGFSKFHSYTGNGNADGPFVYTGFRPKFVMIKNTSSTYSWWLVDTARNPINLAQNTLAPNSSAAEFANEGIDILSNGFKARANGQNTNNNGSNYIYMAFAENPFKNSNAR